MSTATALMTAEQFARKDFGAWAELVRGEVVQMARPEPPHGLVCNNVCYPLTTWSRGADSGYVISNDAGVVTERDPDTVRGPDAMFVPMDRCPKKRVPTSIDILPSLVIEVMSPSDRWKQLLKKVGEYLERGVSEVWIVDPRKRQVHVYRADDEPTVLTEDDVIRSETVLPGFECKVSEFFVGL